MQSQQQAPLLTLRFPEQSGATAAQGVCGNFAKVADLQLIHLVTEQAERAAVAWGTSGDLRTLRSLIRCWSTSTTA